VVTGLLRSAVMLLETRAGLLECFGANSGFTGTRIKEVEDTLLAGTQVIRSIMDAALQYTGDLHGRRFRQTHGRCRGNDP